VSSFAHLPLSSRIIGVTLGCQSLNEPAIQAFCAVERVSSKRTHCEPQPVSDCLLLIFIAASYYSSVSS